MDRRRLRRASTLGILSITTLGLFAHCVAPESPRPVATPQGGGGGATATQWTMFAKTVQPFLVKNCASCHGANNPEAGIRLDNFADAQSVEKSSESLTRALKMLRTNKMPPSDQPQPSAEERKPVIAWLDAFATQAALAESKNPGHVTLHRLNRAEYNNTVRDLLGVEFKPADSFPADDAGYGFDNNGDVLTLAPMLLDKYLTAAEMVLDKAIMVQPVVEPPVTRWDAAILEGTLPKGNPTPANAGTANAGQNNPRGREFPYLGEIYVTHDFPKTGNYILRLKGYGTQGVAPQSQPAAAGAAGGGRGRGPQGPRPMAQFKLDGQLVDKPLAVASDFRGQLFFATNSPVQVKAGSHVIALAFVNGATKEELDAVLEAQALAAANPPADAAAGAGNPAGDAAGNPAANPVANPAAAPAANGRGFGGRGRGNRGGANGAAVPANGNAAPAAAPANGAAAGDAPAAANGIAVPTPPNDNTPVAAPASQAPAAAPANAAVAPATAAAGAPAPAAPVAQGRGVVPQPPPANVAQGRGRGQTTAPGPSPTGKPTLGVVFVEAEGPVDITLERMPESFRKVFVTLPSDTVTKEQAAKQIITNFVTRAYRRPVKATETDRLMAYWMQIDASGETFDRSIAMALQPVLASPNFLYRVEAEPTAKDPDGVRTLNEFELASRLSYFLWSSMPDDELMQLDGQGKLRANLDSQVQRMLASPKSFALCENFAGQWLQLRKMAIVLPDAKKFPDFDEPLRDAMLKETQLFFSAVIKEDRSILDFVDADFTYMNERLAKHYGRTDIKGEEFQRVTLSGNQRGGILTQASILTITSYPSRTSPVIRGKWVLENLLDQAPPPPPPNVPSLKEGEQVDLTATLRVRMEQHRSNPNCVSCHSAMDPIGFGLENFDAIGAWRDKDVNGSTIDASGKLPDGQTFEGPAGLKKILLAEKDVFCEALVNRMMTYALGRGMEQGDRPRIQHIAEVMKQKDYKFSALVMQIVTSDSFQKQGLKKGDDK